MALLTFESWLVPLRGFGATGRRAQPRASSPVQGLLAAALLPWPIRFQWGSNASGNIDVNRRYGLGSRVSTGDPAHAKAAGPHYLYAKPRMGAAAKRPA
jgi:hypothetical protein